MRSGRKGNDSDKLVQYLYKKPTQRSNLSTNMSANQQWQEIQQAFEHLTQRITLNAYDLFVAQKSKHSSEVAWNLCSVQLTKVIVK